MRNKSIDNIIEYRLLSFCLHIKENTPASIDSKGILLRSVIPQTTCTLHRPQWLCLYL